MGTLATMEKIATSRTCNCPSLPIADAAARRFATRRPSSTKSAMAGTRLATRSSATMGGVSSAKDWPLPESR
jgi:hypothetical protein